MQKIIDLKKQNLSKNIHYVLLSLGSNIEPREEYLKKAIYHLQNDGLIEIIKTSSLLNNSAILYTEQEDFLNQLVEIKTHLSPLELLHYVKMLEKILGRKERFRYGPREIDIDILFYDTTNIKTQELILPHPGVYDREYLKILFKEFDLSKYNY